MNVRGRKWGSATGLENEHETGNCIVTSEGRRTTQAIVDFVKQYILEYSQAQVREKPTELCRDGYRLQQDFIK